MTIIDELKKNCRGCINCDIKDDCKHNILKEVKAIATEYLKELSPKNKRNEFEKGVAFGLDYMKVKLKALEGE